MATQSSLVTGDVVRAVPDQDGDLQWCEIVHVREGAAVVLEHECVADAHLIARQLRDAGRTPTPLRHRWPRRATRTVEFR